MGDRVAVMAWGFATASTIRGSFMHRPTSSLLRYRTPPMNLFEATLERKGDAVQVVLADQHIALPPRLFERYPRVGQSVGARVLVGVRPEDVHLANTRPELAPIVGKLGLVEILGSSQIAYMNIAAQKVSTSTTATSSAQGGSLPDTEEATSFTPNLVAIFPPQFSLRLGDNVPIALDSANLHFFDADTGAALR